MTGFRDLTDFELNFDRFFDDRFRRMYSVYSESGAEDKGASREAAQMSHQSSLKITSFAFRWFEVRARTRIINGLIK